MKNYLLTGLLLTTPCYAQSGLLQGVGGSVPTAAASLVCDSKPNADCYGFRLMRTAYAGNPAIKIQRISDSSYQDIGFSGNDLDAAAIVTFCTGTNCKVTTTYEQGLAGGGNAVQDNGNGYAAGAIYCTTAVSPCQNTSGLQTFNGKACQNFDNATALQGLQTGIPGAPTSTTLVMIVAKSTWDATNNFTLLGSDGDSTGQVNFRVNAGPPYYQQTVIAAVGGGGTGTTAVPTTGTDVEFSWNPTNGDFAFWVDGASAGSGTNLASETPTSSKLNIGGTWFAKGINGYECEVVVTTTWSSSDRIAAESDIRSYWGTP